MSVSLVSGSCYLSCADARLVWRASEHMGIGASFGNAERGSGTTIRLSPQDTLLAVLRHASFIRTC
jgi:hypothetical protein